MINEPLFLSFFVNIYRPEFIWTHICRNPLNQYKEKHGHLLNYCNRSAHASAEFQQLSLAQERISSYSRSYSVFSHPNPQNKTIDSIRNKTWAFISSSEHSWQHTRGIQESYLHEAIWSHMRRANGDGSSSLPPMDRYSGRPLEDSMLTFVISSLYMLLINSRIILLAPLSTT
ncbi:hypothetical protein ABKN59_002574 [Abortiporus biennis]